MTEERVLRALRSVMYPGFTRNIVDLGVVRDLRVDGDSVSLRIDLVEREGSPETSSTIERAVRGALAAIGASAVDIRTGGLASDPRGLPLLSAPASRPSGSSVENGVLPGVRHTIAVASGKGGVGKSTVAVNLAVALGMRGARVGLLDADIYGPSIPLMMGTDERPALTDSGQSLLPFDRFGVRFMSLGFLVEPDAAVIWRGPMVMKAVSQLLTDVAWGELDVLVVDMPPGTGDAQLTLSQKVRLAGAVIVTTPQDVALADAIKGVAMFRKVGVPILGIIENMSFFSCAHCGARTDIFGHGGGQAQAKRLQVPFLGEIAIDPAIRDSGDRGTPITSALPDSAPSRAFLRIAEEVLATMSPGQSGPRDDGDGFFGRLRKGWSNRSV